MLFPTLAEIEKTAEDVKTLWIDVDGKQERHNEWRAVVQESYVERHLDSPVGPDCCEHMLRFGGSPRGWLEMWCREHYVDRKDRTYHELETLTEITMLGGAYDQLNMPSLMSFKKVSRRLQLIVEGPWRVARYNNGVSTLTDVVSHALRQYGTRQAKEEAQVGVARVRTRRCKGQHRSGEPGCPSSVSTGWP